MKLMRAVILFAGIVALAAGPVRADLTIVQKIEGMTGSPSEITMKIKGDKVRMEISPQVTMIFDGKTSEMTTLMNDEKKAVRISSDQMKAAAETIKKFTGKKEDQEAAGPAKFVATGRKEKVNEYETEIYTYDGSDFKGTYWLALNYPNGPEILKQFQAIRSDAWSAANTHLPDYHDLPGIPLKSRMTLKEGESGQSEITTSIVSIKTDSLNDAEFLVPKDFKEMEMPNIFGGHHRSKRDAPSVSATP